MKRLIKKANMLTLYHGTSAYIYNKLILTNGLKNVYLTDKIETAQYYANENKACGGGFPVVLTIQIDENELSNLGKIYIDSNMEYVHNLSNSEEEYIKDWKTSLNKFHSIYFAGTIPAKYITKVQNVDGSEYIFDKKYVNEIYNPYYI